jgi:hypothetical protein
MKKKTPFKQKADRLKQDVVDFLSRVDNSRILPGQTDAVKVGKGKKKPSTDYIHNLTSEVQSRVENLNINLDYVQSISAL